MTQNWSHTKIRVAVILPSLARCGPVLVAQNIILALQQEVLFTVFYFDEILEVTMPVPCHKISFNTNLEVKQFDVIHSHMLRPDLYVWYHHLHKKIPVVSTLHQYIYESLSYTYGSFIASLFTPVWRRALSKMHRIACINQHMASYYSSLGAKGSVFEIYNGVEEIILNEVLEHQQLLEIKSRFNIVGNIALLVKRKGLDQLVHSLTLDTNRFLILVGEGPERKNLESLAQQLGVADRLIITGFKANARDYLPYMDVFVMPSHSEGFGLALVEAVAAQIPVVASRIPSFQEMFEPNEICFFELGSFDSLNNAIHRAQQEKLRLIQLAYHKYITQYTNKQMAMKYLACYQRLSNANNEELK